MTNSTTNVLVTTDISHPAVAVIEVTASSKGYFLKERAETLLNAWAAKAKVPTLRENGLGIALRRSMEALAHGPSMDLKTIGRGHHAVLTLITTDLSGADLEHGDGVGIGSAEVSARINLDGQTTEIVISPSDHPARDTILASFERHKAQVSATHDVKSWLLQQALPALGAMKSPDALGKAWLPANKRTVAAMQSLQAVMSELADHNGKVSVYVTGRSGSDESIVDLITDTLLEEVEREQTNIRGSLGRITTLRGFESQGDKAMKLRKRLKAVADAFGIGCQDIEKVITDLEIDIAIAVSAIPSK